MYQHDFGWQRLPFTIQEDGVRLTTDPVILGAVRRALLPHQPKHSLPRWLRQNGLYLRRSYTFDEHDIERFGWEYIWVVQLSYLLARELGAQGGAGFTAPQMPFGFTGTRLAFAPDDALAFHAAVFSNWVNRGEARESTWQQGLSRSVRLSDHFVWGVVKRLSRTYRLAREMSPDRVVEMPAGISLAPGATDYHRWPVNIFYIADRYVNDARHRRPQYERQSRRPPKQRKSGRKK